MGDGSLVMGFGAWNWFILAGLLLGFELITPGMMLLWFGIAAGMTGVIAFVTGVGWQAQMVIFALLSGLCVLIGRRMRGARATPDIDATLNRRADRHVGRVFVLEEPIVNGAGRVRIDDTVWRVAGDDAPGGAHVRVVRVDGSSLMVARVDHPGAADAASNANEVK